VDPEEDHRQLEEDAVDQDDDQERETTDYDSDEEPHDAVADARDCRKQPHETGQYDYQDVDDLHDRRCDELLEGKIEQASETHIVILLAQWSSYVEQNAR